MESAMCIDFYIFHIILNCLIEQPIRKFIDSLKRITLNIRRRT